MNNRYVPLIVVLFSIFIFHHAGPSDMNLASSSVMNVDCIIRPSEVKAGEIIPVCVFQFQAKHDADRMRISIPGMFWYNRGDKPDELSPLVKRAVPQTSDPESAGFIDIANGPSDAVIKIISSGTDVPRGENSSSRSRIFLSIESLKGWSSGEKFTLRFRDMRAQVFAGEASFKAEEYISERPQLLCQGKIRIIPDKPLSLMVNVKTENQNSAVIRVVALDHFGNRANWNGTLKLQAESLFDEKILNFTDVHMKNGASDALMTYEDEDCFRVVVLEPPFPSVSGGPVVGREVLNHAKNSRILWGDIHTHTALSDAYVEVTPESAAEYARDTAYLDFLALTDHAEIIWGNGLSSYDKPEDMITEFAESNTDSDFTVISGYEWTPGYYGDSELPGHLTILFPDEDISIVPYEQKQSVNGMEAVKSLSEKLSSTRAIAIPHHIGASFAPWNFEHWLPELMPAVEIISSHGIYEDNAVKAVASGIELNFTGGGDGHTGRPGIRRTPGYHGGIPLDAGGITWVRINNSDNRDVSAQIVHAIQNGKCGASTGSRVILDLHKIDNKLLATAFSAEELSSVKLIEISSDNSDVKEYEVEIKNSFWASDMIDFNENNKSSFYLKAVQNNGEICWSSPHPYFQNQ